jgi:ferredoxin
MDIEVHKLEKINTGECISCGRCVEACPDPGNMIALRAGRKVIKPLLAVLASAAVFFGSILLLDAAGLYTVSLPSQQEVLQKGVTIGIQDLRGSMTIEQGAFYTGKALAEFYRIMEIPERVSKDTQLKYVANYVKGYDFHRMKALKAGQ